MDKKNIQEVLKLKEASFGDDGNARIIIIEEGFNRSKSRYYTESALNRGHKLFEGKKMYLNHESDWTTRERGARDVRDWVAFIVETEMGLTSEGKNAIFGKIKIHDSDFKEKLKELKEADLLGELGVSINAFADGERKDQDGIMTNVVTEFIEASSVDFVTEPGAGGRVENFKESIGGENEMDLNNLSLAQIKESRPDLIESLSKEIKESITPDQETQEPDQSADKTDEFAIREGRLDRKEILSDILGQSSLPANAKDRVKESVLNSEVVMKDGRLDIQKTKESINKVIESEESYIKELTSAKVTESNSSGVTTKEEGEKIMESLQKNLDNFCGISVKEAE